MKIDFGFTLVELIVTVTVILVLTGVGAMSLNNFNGVKELETTREEVGSYIKLARNLAITKQLPNEASNLEYVKVTITSNEIAIEGVDSNGQVFNSSPYSKIKLNLNKNVTLLPSSFGFLKSSGRLTDNNGLGASNTVIVSVNRQSDTKTISIKDTGLISNEDGIVSDAVLSNEKARDSQRITDLNRIMAALVKMRQAEGGTIYPFWLNKVEENGYIDRLPLDPKNSTKYCYWSGTPGYIAAFMEDIGSTNTRQSQLIGGYNTEYCYFNYKLMLPL